MSYFTETFNYTYNKIMEDAANAAKDFMYGAAMGTLFGPAGMTASIEHPYYLEYKSRNGKTYHGDLAFNVWWTDIITSEKEKDDYKSLSATEKYKRLRKIQKFVNDECRKAVRSKQWDLNRIKINY